jgi:hypothetical protein
MDPMDEYERRLRALNQYRVLAAEDDGELLPVTENPVEPGDYYAGVPRFDSPTIADRRSSRGSGLRRFGCIKVHWWKQSKGFNPVMGLNRMVASTQRRLTSLTRRWAFGFDSWNWPWSDGGGIVTIVIVRRSF